MLVQVSLQILFSGRDIDETRLVIVGEDCVPLYDDGVQCDEDQLALDHTTLRRLRVSR